MTSILLGPIGPRAAGEGGGKRAAGERVCSIKQTMHVMLLEAVFPGGGGVEMEPY
jgi:hypothetical protein